MNSITIITGDQLRHNYFVNQISSEFNVQATFSEIKPFGPTLIRTNKESSKYQLMENYFNQFRVVEKKYFGKHRQLINTRQQIIKRNAINLEENIRLLEETKPDLILCFGSGIIKEDIIDLFPGKIINLHLGLSPHYRGSGTNIWPIINEEPEYVGATIHYLDKGVDTGQIIAQARPTLSKNDNHHDLGCKAIISGTEKMRSVINSFFNKTIKSYEQETTTGKQYFRKDFTPETIQLLEEKISKKVISRSIERLEREGDPVTLIGI
ncbi:MAG: hypothetical protein KC535_04040 [Nanoarchaeota archaeon]|nr:hypothetical protein [Nanoarchaeota archaeon]